MPVISVSDVVLYKKFCPVTQFTCKADGCMMWRWAEPCVSDCDICDKYDEDEGGSLVCQRNGYCGAAGEPTFES